MKEIMVYLIWRSEVTLEVPDDFEWTGSLDDFTENQLEEMDPRNAELVDWSLNYENLRQR